MKNLTTVLNNYDIHGEIIGQKKGPLLEIIEFVPEPGTKVRNIFAVIDDIRRELGVSSLRLETSPNGNSLFFEIPAKEFETVDFTKILASTQFESAKEKYALPLCLGADILGEPVFADLAKMPHLLIGGTTGSGKSIGLNVFILSLIASLPPKMLKFVLIDPKKVEFSLYNNQKYLLAPVVSETAEAAAVLTYLTEEMDRRYERFADVMVKNIAGYNAKESEKMPYIVCVIDEFADLMATQKDVETDVIRLAQKARAAGIHLILSTQRPSVDVVTGVLKANFPTRLAYKTASATDSRTILDAVGAENLIGRGDSLLLASDGELTRLHGAYLPDDEIDALLKPYRAKVKPLVSLPEVNAGSIVAKQNSKTEPKKEGFFKRMIRFWADLRVKDRQLIIRVLKYALAYLLGVFSQRKKRK